MTNKPIWLGNGLFYFNYGETDETLVGATKGGGSFAVEREYKPIERDGTYGTVKGEVRKISVVPKLTINALELSTDNLEKFYGMTASEETGYTKLTEGVDVADTDFIKNVAFVGKRADGKQIVIIVENALGNGNLELAFENKEEVATEVTYEGCYDPTALETPPYEIRLYA